MVLFAVIDILGSVPIIVSLRKQFGHIDSERASIVSGGLMIVFFFRRQNAEIHWYRC